MPLVAGALDLAHDVAHHLAAGRLSDTHQRGPFCKVVEVKVEVVGFCEGVDIDFVELPEVVALKGADRRHVLAQAAAAARKCAQTLAMSETPASETKRSRFSLRGLVSSVQAAGSQAVKGVRAAGTQAVQATRQIGGTVVAQSRSTLAAAKDEVISQTARARDASTAMISPRSNLPAVDVDVDAGAVLLDYFQQQREAVAANNASTSSVATEAHHTLTRQRRFCEKAASSVASLESELDKIGSITSLLAQTVDEVADVKDAISACEEALQHYEALLAERSVAKHQHFEDRRVAVHHHNSQKAVAKSCRALKSEHDAMARAAERETQRELEEKRAIYDDLFRQQMEYFKQHRRTDVIPYDRSDSLLEAHLIMDGVESPTKDHPIDPLGIDDLQDFLADMQPLETIRHDDSSDDEAPQEVEILKDELRPEDDPDLL
eukprot:m.31533 g.31533  ORF g.31533 m.31533 type:complete len:434 (-) comp5372_c0_seq1:1426-2727(-)